MSVSQFRKHFDKEKAAKKLKETKDKVTISGFYFIEVLDPKITSLDESSDFYGVNLGNFCQAYELIINDMPLEDLTKDSNRLNSEKLQSFFESNRLNGERFYLCIAVNSENDEVAGLTQTMLNEHNTKLAEQGDTGVLRVYRGNRLGLTMKYHTLKYLLEQTESEYWMTGNADTNSYMIAINDILHYEEWFIGVEYEFTIEKIKSLVS